MILPLINTFITEITIDDFEIVLNVLSGNPNAYAELVRKYEGRVRGYCLMMLSNPTQAEDAAQEIFIKAYEALSKFHGKSSFATWIYRISVNHCNDLLRKKIRRKTESWESLLEKEGEQIESIFAVSPNFQTREERELLMKLLSSLPETHRTVLILREIEELSYEELSGTLACSVDAVKSRLKRARKELLEKARHFLGTKTSKQ